MTICSWKLYLSIILTFLNNMSLMTENALFEVCPQGQRDVFKLGPLKGEDLQASVVDDNSVCSLRSVRILFKMNHCLRRATKIDLNVRQRPVGNAAHLQNYEDIESQKHNGGVEDTTVSVNGRQIEVKCSWETGFHVGLHLYAQNAARYQPATHETSLVCRTVLHKRFCDPHRFINRHFWQRAN